MIVPEVPLFIVDYIFEIGKHLVFGIPAHLKIARAQRRIHQGTFAARVGDYVLVIIYFTYYY